MGITQDKLGKPIKSSIGEELLNHVKDSNLTNEMVKIDGDNISFKKKDNSSINLGWIDLSV